MDDMYMKFKKYIVYAESLKEFCDQWNKPDKVGDKEADYEEHKKKMEKYGFTFIPAATSKTGEIVSYYGKINSPHHEKGGNKMKTFPKYVKSFDGYIGVFCYLDFGEFPVYRFPGGERIADNWEIKNGSDNREDLE